MRHRPVVCQIITRLIVGGAQRTVFELCRGLRDDYEIHVACGPDLGPEGSMMDEFRDVAPVTIVDSLRRDLRPADDLRVVRQLRHKLRCLGPDIVHTHSSKAGIVGRRAANHLHVRTVHTIHGWGHTPADSPLRRQAFVGLERMAARWADALIAVSPEVEAEGLGRGIGSADRYRVIPEGVDFTPSRDAHGEARQKARAELRLDPDATVVGWVGRFAPQKDPDTLLRALTALVRERPDVRAVLIGDGPLRGLVEAQIRRMGLSEHIMLAGLRPDARSLMPAFDLLLHLSRWEGHPRVIQEAIGERVPVVATRTAGVAGLVLEGRVGHVVDPGDWEEAAVRAAALLDDKRIGPPLDAAVVASIAERNSVEAMLAAHRVLYGDLLAVDG